MQPKLNLTNYYEAINSESKDIKIVNTKDGALIRYLKTIFAKSLEFNIQINQSDKINHLYFTPYLRSICEEYISIRYLFSKMDDPDAEQLSLAYLTDDITQTLDKQEKFFSKNRKEQPILLPQMVNLPKVDIDHLKSKYGWNRKKPSVYEMAEKSGLDELYDFLYRATSRAVHFNPYMLDRLAWGSVDSLSNLTDQTEFIISDENFKLYYEAFNRFWGAYLFLEFTDFFTDTLNLSDKISENLGGIRKIFNDNRRWPELVTFEELNIPIKEGIKKFHFVMHPLAATMIYGLEKK